MNRYLKLLIALGLPQTAGLIGSFFTTPNISTWYEGLSKPELAPPNWIFAPVWTTIFVLMGIAFFLVWNKGMERKDVKIASVVFVIQLVFNTLWSVIFFGMQSPFWGFVWIILLWLLIALNIFIFFRISKITGWLLVPYILWASFAAYLNYAIWMLN
ncbi:MAG: TspO/MBR family protein [Patescibacteria group bacterium]